MVAGETGIEAKRLVFVDECGANISLVPMYAWSRRGERAPAKAPRNWGKNVTLLSSMSIEGMGPSLAVEGATTRGVFETYLEGVRCCRGRWWSWTTSRPTREGECARL